MHAIIWLILMAVGPILTSSSSLTPVIRLSDGSKVQGVIQSSLWNPEAPVWEFLGIPYSKPPVGAARFQPPQPNEPWTGVLKAVKPGPICQQKVNGSFVSKWILSNNLSMSENCLLLNIWTPPRKSDGTLLPVMVFIHGGGFYSGSNSYPNGKVLANRENVIVVSMAYRLSIFGFLFSGGPEAPGNMGLLDQLQALKWVKVNIKNFGGNPDMVTLFGISSGSACVSFHAISPLSQPYFNRLILQSGLATNPWAITDQEALKLQLVRVASKVDCYQEIQSQTHDQFPRIVECLKSKEAHELLNAFEPLDDEFLSITFTPVVDGHFLVQQPITSLKERQFEKTDVMLGTTAHEGTNFFLMYFPAIRKYRNMTEDAFRSLLAVSTMKKYRNNNFVKNAVYMEYNKFSYENSWDDQMLALDELNGDVYISCDVSFWANRYSDKIDHGNVFRYVFNYGDRSLPSWQRSLHGSDKFFVFGYPIAMNSSVKDIEVSQLMMRYWANFARTGNPNVQPNGSFTPIYWPPYNNTENYIILDLYPHSGHSYRKRQCYFWQQFIPDLYSRSHNCNESTEDVVQDTSSIRNYFFSVHTSATDK